jgi:hypothetical protein
VNILILFGMTRLLLAEVWSRLKFIFLTALDVTHSSGDYIVSWKRGKLSSTKLGFHRWTLEWLELVPGFTIVMISAIGSVNSWFRLS